MASSSTLSVHANFKYHVYLSFRGEDTRKTFVDHLYASLKRLGIRTFRDNEGLEKGKRIDELFKAIEESKFFIIVFSKNYASSSWCLKELRKIMECQDGKERIAYPLFHDVDPSDIRKQSGPVGEAIAKHTTDQQIIKTWKKALEDAGNLVGWDIKKIANGHEAAAIDQVLKELSLKLRLIHMSNNENLVGMESRMKDVESSLRMDLKDEVRMIGIKGMGGIGKTTLARAIFHKISSQFEGICFVENVREASKVWRGLLTLQQQVLRDVFGDDSMNRVQDPISMMKDRMPSKKVLLVLDDVDRFDQLEALTGDWFKGGSRIIIATRNEQLLKAHGVDMNWIHDINLLSDEEAVNLFSRYAFKRDIPYEGFKDLSLKVVKYAAGLPLTLKVLASSLFGKKKDAWEDALKRLDTIPEKETLDKLEISYVGLEDDYKEIFLDVACFMKGMLKEDAVRMLESRGFHAITGLTVLEDRSLITIDKTGCLGMHDSIEEMGRNIVRRAHPDKPKKHSRLWIPKELKALLSDDAITKATATCIRMDSTDMSLEIILRGLEKLKKLSVLYIYGRHDDCPHDNRMFDEDYFPNALQFLKWERYPGLCLPQAFRANNLVGLELPGSRITKLWESEEQKVLSNLRFLDLSDSKLRTLNLGMTPNLERLELQGCRNLTEIHAPAGSLESLVYLNLLTCSQFNSFSFIQQLESLKILTLPKLQVTVMSYLMYAHERLPELLFKSLYYEEQASSLENSQKSVSLDLKSGKKIESVSGSFFGLQHLRHLKVKGPIPELPNDLNQLANLEELNLVSTHIKCIPESICMIKSLKSLELQSCRLLKKLPRNLAQLECLEKLILIDCESLKDIPKSICNMKCLRYFCLPHCKQIENLPEELGSLKHLKVLDIRFTGINHLPKSISLLEGLRIAGSVAVLQSCDSATEIQTSEDETFWYIQAAENTEAGTKLEIQSAENFCSRHETEAIDQIVKEVSLKLQSIHLSNIENLIGMESRMQDVESSLRMDLEDEVRMIGIKGMGGTGKTTLARAIYQKLSSQFDGSCFVENIREASNFFGGLLSLQRQVLKDVFGDNNVFSIYDAESMMKHRMPFKKVLLILDDVDDLRQLDALAGDLNGLKGGSRIIITTRYGQLLKAHGVYTNWTHDINILSDEEAFSFFNRYAFKKDIPDEGYDNLSLKAVKYAAGLPIMLKVLGSFLLGKKKLAWKDTLDRLETIPEKETLAILEISYDGLTNDHKEIFLDVACFMKGLLKGKAIRKLESRGFHAITGLTVLEERSLISFNKYGCLGMHDSIQELGRNIVRREHPDEPNKHSRLWIEEEIEALLSDDEVTEATATCISTSSINLNSEIIMKGLRKLKNLKFLHISGNDEHQLPDNWMLDEEDSFPNSLRFLQWFRYPGRCLPQTFLAKNLVGLEMRESKITKLWESGEREVLKKLRFLDLRGSKLRSLDLGMTPNLERLELQRCRNLTDIHAPAGCLKRLVYLNLKKCSSFRSSSSFIQQLESAELLSLPKLLVTQDFLGYFECRYVEEQASPLEYNQKSVSLDLQPGTKIESVSGSFFHLQHIRDLTFDGCIPELPNDLDQLTYLEELDLGYTNIKSLPDNICMMRHLKSLKLKSSVLEELPKDLGQLDRLEKLSVSSARITHVPDSICMLKNLKSLELVHCQHLKELPRDLGQLECLEELILYGCESLEDIPNSICNMKHLKELDISATGIRQLPQSISSLEDLRVFGDVEVLQSLAAFATEIEFEYEEDWKERYFCYIKVVNSTPAPTELRSHSTENNLKREGKEILVEDDDEGAPGGGIRIEEITDEVATPISEKDEASSSNDVHKASIRWRWSMVVVPVVGVVGLLVSRVIKARVLKKKVKL